jgi:hypothetical protein
LPSRYRGRATADFAGRPEVVVNEPVVYRSPPAIIKGLKLASPRGPITIDPQTRDIVQTVYIRRVEKVDGRLENVEFEQFTDIKETGFK